MQHLVLEVKGEMPAQVGREPHGLHKGFHGDALHQFRPPASTDAALHRQRVHELEAVAFRQPGAADQIVAIDPGSAAQ